MKRLGLGLFFILVALMFPCNCFAAGMSFNMTAKQFKALIFVAVESHTETVDISSCNLKRDKVVEYMTEYFSEYINAYKINQKFMPFDYNCDGIIDELKLTYKYDDTKATDAELGEKVSYIADLAKNNATDTEKISAVYNYFVSNYDYDVQHTNAYELLNNNSGNCCGFSLLFREVMNKLDIPCNVVINQTMTHEWNSVVANGKIYYIDIAAAIYQNNTTANFMFDETNRSGLFYLIKNY